MKDYKILGFKYNLLEAIICIIVTIWFIHFMCN